MIIKNNTKGYSTKRKHIQGAGFFDSLKSIGSYIAQNKDLIAKPVLGAVGNLTALGIEKGLPELISHIRNKSKQTAKNTDYINSNKLTNNDVEIIKNILNNDQSLSNIIGSGIKKF